MTTFSASSLRLYLVLDPGIAAADPLEIADTALANGVTCLQLRWKSATDRELCELADGLANLCRNMDVPFIVNDRLDIALAVGADGIHLGVDDLPIETARRIAGDTFVIGYSPDSDTHLAEAERSGATYLGIGPFAATATKSDAGAALGPAEFTRRRGLTNLPVVAIGGLGAHNIPDAIRAGADGIAVASAIAAARDPGSATLTLRRALSMTS